ncbi:hypothetical protein STCU_03913 [Strigomonas culicis]|nr:hypothetical protein STCU_03913 [Strigomonas culicis]|eukprot:EPY30746.1 hypothetical protein STCU_03913 [Strigomonas culicis]
MPVFSGCQSCRKAFHMKCLELKTNSLHTQGSGSSRNLMCLNCGENVNNSVAQSVKKCSKCSTTMQTDFFECLLCEKFSLCPSCHKCTRHNHPLIKRAIRTVSNNQAKVENVNELLFREINPEDYDVLLSLDTASQGQTKNHVLSTQEFDRISVRNASVVSESSKCPICLEFYRRGEKCVVLPCGHTMHFICGRKWLTECSENCPVDHSSARKDY